MKDKKRILGLTENSCAKSYGDIQSIFCEMYEFEEMMIDIGRIS